MIVEKKNKDGIVIWKVDKLNKSYEYCFQLDCAQSKIIKKLIFNGYTKQPTSLNANGYGYSRAMKPFVFILEEYFGTIEKLEISDIKKTSLSTRNKKIYIVINKIAYESFLANCNEIYKENSKRIKEVSYNGLQVLFPKHLPKLEIQPYKKNTISKILQNDDIINSLSLKDIEDIAHIIPKIMDKSTSLKKEVLNKLLFEDISNKAKKIQLTNIISTYENLLSKKTQKENDWQQFLKENMLFFNSSYINLIEKQNISLGIALPDFLLIDQFQFIDIFEIKRPDFDCLKYDSSHDNFFWSEETSKAIAQVEKYIYEIELNAANLMKTLREEGLDVKIIRPRGFILIGKRESLDSKKKENAFRILERSLTNIQIIFYDDFLNSIKNKYSIINK